MSEKLRGAVRKPRTRFSPQQLGALRAAFRETMYPDWGTVQQLTASTGLDDTVIVIWFKNQRARVKRQRPETRPGEAPAAPGGRLSGAEEEEEEEEADTPPPASPGLPGAAAPRPPGPAPPEPPSGAGLAAVSPAPEEPLPRDLHDICLRACELPWACCPLAVEEMARLYGCPGDADPSGLDRYLLPSGPSQGGCWP